MHSQETILEEVKNFADKAHGTQQRKYTPERYIVHPVRVMEICREYTQDTSVLAAALLHDVLEDTPVRKKEINDFLLQWMPPATVNKTIDLVVELTDVYTKNNYPQWNRRRRKMEEAARIEQTSADAQTIKYADIIDNSREIVQHDADFAKVFLSECRTLLQKMNKGNSHLYEKAMAQVEKGLQALKSRRLH